LNDNNDNILDNNDKICDENGNINFLYRKNFITLYTLKSHNNEKITSIRFENIVNITDKYASFKDVDLYSYAVSFSDFEPNNDINNGNIQYSSVVKYVQHLSKKDTDLLMLSSLTGISADTTVDGIRYYTEEKKENETECSAIYIDEFKIKNTETVYAKTYTKYYYVIHEDQSRSIKYIYSISVYKDNKGNIKIIKL